MTAKIIDGAALARQIRSDVAQRAATLTAAGVRPGLAVILVGEDPASSVYVRNKVKDCEEAGFHSILDRLPAGTSEPALLERVRALNADPAVHGILVQLPLPPHLDAHRVIETISPDKDVDCFHVSNAGALMTGTPRFKPCTPYGVMRMLESAGVKLAGAEAVVVGRSTIVGKPVAALLLQEHATVTVAHSRTQPLGDVTREADVLVVAIGKAEMVTGDMVKPGATVIDVGVNRIPDASKKSGFRLVGDVHYASAAQVAGLITPVPGGVGPLTIAMLLSNTLTAARRQTR